MKEVYEYIKNSGGVFYLATIDNDKPRVRPIGTLEIIEDKLYILTGKSKNVSKQIETNNNIEICVSNKETWIRIEAKLIRDDRIEIKKAMLDKNPHLRVMYNEEDDNTEVLYLKDATATIESFVADKKVIKF